MEGQGELVLLVLYEIKYQIFYIFYINTKKEHISLRDRLWTLSGINSLKSVSIETLNVMALLMLIWMYEVPISMFWLPIWTMLLLQIQVIFFSHKFESFCFQFEQCFCCQFKW